jgi:hypothetical protein
VGSRATRVSHQHDSLDTPKRQFIQTQAAPVEAAELTEGPLVRSERRVAAREASGHR